MSSKISVDLGERSYVLHISAGGLDALADKIPVEAAGKSFFIITDENVVSPYAAMVESALTSNGAQRVETLTLSAGEQNKSLETFGNVLSWLLDRHISRQSIIIALGGGVIGDLAGFAAASVLRGVPFVQIPTTLLAMVDSSVGGKTGLDMKQGKNLVGAFYQPISVVCDTNVLQTLSQREMKAGYAEIVKYGLIDDASFFLWLEGNGRKILERDDAALIRAVETSCRKKSEIVAADERESGARALLNLGHTFAHGIEGVCGYDGTVLHGEAVAIGMVMAFKLSVRMGLCAAEDMMRVKAHLQSVGLPVSLRDITLPIGTDADQILYFMKHDKKAEQGRAVFVLARGIGQSFVCRDVPWDEARNVVKESL